MEAEDGSLSRSGSALAGTRYENLMSCTGLTDLDTLTKSDPVCVLFYKRFGQWREVGRTEAIKNTLNPKASNGTPEQTMSLHDISENKSAIRRYKKAVKHIRMSGPTRLKPVITFAESLAVREPAQDNQVYHVLLVITDGILNDIDDVLERLTSIGHLPLTVVFAGVGPADFKLMARGTLAVISSQITEYMRWKDIIPNKPSFTSLPQSHSSASLINTSQTEGRGLSRLISRNSMSNATDPKCRTCGSVLDNFSSSATLLSTADVIL